MSGTGGAEIRILPTGPGRTAVIFPSAFVASVAIGFVIFGLTFFARDVLGFEPGRIGLLVGTWPLAYSVACLLVLPLFGPVLPRIFMVASCATMGLSVAALLAWPSPGFVFPLFGLFGFALGFFWTPVMGWLSVGHEGRDLSRLISRFNFSWGVGNMVSPFLCGALYQIRPALPLQIGAVLFFAVAAYVAWASRAFPRVRSDRASGTGVAERAETDRSTPLRYPAWAGLWANYFGIGLLNAVLPLAGRTELGMSSTQVGLAFLLFNLLNVLFFLVLGRWEKWHFRTWPMLASTGFRLVLFLLLMAARGRMPVYVLLAAIGIPYAVAYSTSAFHGCSGALNRSRRMAIHEGILTLAMVMGSAAGGALYGRFSAAAAYGTAAAANAAILALQAVWRSRRPGRSDGARSGG